MKDEKVRRLVKEHYGDIASRPKCGCGCGDAMSPEEISGQIGYSEEEMGSVPEANLGLGCGNPTALGEIKEGEVVLDLGSGAGFDCFLAARMVGKSGKVIGVDMTDQMLETARANALKHGFENVEFRKGYIEELPVDDASVDVIISNCVINLAPDKSRVFREAFRVLKPGGRMYVSDIVLLEELPQKYKDDYQLLVGCVAGAILRDDYIRLMEDVGFSVRILDEDKDISKTQYQGMPLESLKLAGRKE